MEPHVQNLHTRLDNELPTQICWERLNEETGNELVRRSAGMLVEGVELGGEAETVGQVASSYASAVSELREQRRLAASSFVLLVVPMHACMTGLLVFIYEIVVNFNNRLGDVSSELIAGAEAQSTTGVAPVGLDMFQGQDLALTGTMISIVVLILTLANTLVSHFASGGHNLKVASNVSIMCILSGINMLVISMVASALFA